MIKIYISERQKEKIEKIYWDWMSKYHLKDLIAIIKMDSVMENLILNMDKDFNIALKNFF